MSHRPSLSAWGPPSRATGSRSRTGLLLGLIALVLAGLAGWILPGRALVPLQSALRADGSGGASSESRP